MRRVGTPTVRGIVQDRRTGRRDDVRAGTRARERGGGPYRRGGRALAKPLIKAFQQSPPDLRSPRLIATGAVMKLARELRDWTRDRGARNWLGFGFWLQSRRRGWSWIYHPSSYGEWKWSTPRTSDEPVLLFAVVDVVVVVVDLSLVYEWFNHDQRLRDD